MRGDAVREQLEERRAVAATRLLRRVAHRVIDGGDVVAVDAQRLDAVPERLDRDRLGRGLEVAGRRDRPLVVLADQHDGHLHHAREVPATLCILKKPILRSLFSS